MYSAAAARALYYPTQTTGAFEVSRDGLPARDSPSFPGNCMHNEEEEEEEEEEAEPSRLLLTASPASSCVHWATGTHHLPTLLQLILFLVT